MSLWLTLAVNSVALGGVQQLPGTGDPGDGPVPQRPQVADDAGRGTGDIRIEPGPTKASTSRMDLIFGFVEYGNHLNLTVEYDTDLFLEASICMLMEKLELLLAKAVATPQTPIGGFDLQDALEDRFAMPTALADFDIDLF